MIICDFITEGSAEMGYIKEKGVKEYEESV